MLMHHFINGDHQAIDAIHFVRLASIHNRKVVVGDEHLGVPGVPIVGLAICGVANLATGEVYTRPLIFDSEKWAPAYGTWPNDIWLGTGSLDCYSPLTAVDQQMLNSALQRYLNQLDPPAQTPA